MQAATFITGASGYVGRALVGALRNMNQEVVALPRATSADFPIDVEQRPTGDIAKSVGLKALLQGASTVIHLAGLVHKPGTSEQDFATANIAATKTLAEAAALAGVRHFVFVSSIAVNGQTSGTSVFSETDAPNPNGAYARSKLLAEQHVQSICLREGVAWTIVRPPVVYGPGAPGNFARLIRLVRSGLPLPLGTAFSKRSMIGIDNLVSALICVATHANSANRLYLVRDEDEVSVREMIELIAQVCGRPARLFPVPQTLLTAALAAIGGRDDAKRLLMPLRSDISRIRRELDWTPYITVAEGVRRAVRTEDLATISAEETR